jgi:probable non-F420 flavinoid oxidoreductase
MATIGFHGSHELYGPADLLEYVRQAEAAGFTAAMCSDHFHPWTPQQGQSAFSFSWLGAALQGCTLPIGTICCPIDRYHPAIIAQAAATLAVMFPRRFWLALGTGQALNEHITGAPWPSKQKRQQAVASAAATIRALWAGDEVTSEGPPQVDRARLYTRPVEPPLLLGAATTPETAAWVATWADGLLTVNAGAEQMESIVTAFRAHGGERKAMFLQAMVGYDPDEELAWQRAIDNWPVAGLSQEELQNIETPEQFDAATRNVKVEDLRGKLRVSSELTQHSQWIEDDLTLGFDAVFLYTISGNPSAFIDAFGKYVLPRFK